MPNPLLNERSLDRAGARGPGQAGWALPTPETPGRRQDGNPPPPPLRDEPGMTVAGTASTTLMLVALLVAAGLFGWSSTPVAGGTAQLPAWTLAAILLGVGLAIVVTFKPTLARVLAPVYAVVEGAFLGAISRVYETAYDGIVLQAVGATLGVFVVMLLLHTTGVLRVTGRMRRTVIGMTLGVMVFYGAMLLAGLFGANLAFLANPSPLGILFSLFVAGLAAVNLSLDFDFIERGARAGLPRHMEWFAAFGLLVTLVWLYLEILRLLAKLRGR